MLSAVTHHTRGLVAALAFLSRVAPPQRDAKADERAAATDTHAATCDLQRCAPWFPAAGAVLGLIATLPVYLATACLPSFPPALAGWLYIAVLAYVTRALHWDGLADICDACGSGAQGDRFWDIMKDSRIGAFGVLGVVLGVSLALIAASLCCEKGLWPALVLAPAFGRSMGAPLAALAAPSPRSTLAALLFPGFRTQPALLTAAATFAACAILTSPATAATALVPAAAALFTLRRIASRNGGCNGDFFGTAILAGETALLLAAALVL